MRNTLSLACAGAAVFYGSTARYQPTKIARIARYSSAALFAVASIVFLVA